GRPAGALASLTLVRLIYFARVTSTSTAERFAGRAAITALADVLGIEGKSGAARAIAARAAEDMDALPRAATEAFERLFGEARQPRRLVAERIRPAVEKPASEGRAAREEDPPKNF